MRFRGFALAASVGVLLLTGCAGEEERSAAENPSEEIIANVSYDEYRMGFDNFNSCMSQAGFALVDVKSSGSAISYGIPAAAVDSSTADDCYREHFERLDKSWQLANEDSSESANFIRRCLAEKGLDDSGTMRELTQRATEEGVDLAACLDSGG